MKLRYVFIVDAIVTLIFAAGLLLAPKTILNLFGLNAGSTVRNTAILNLIGQLLGAALVAPGLLSWFAGGMQDMSSRRSVAVVLFIFSIIGFGVSFFVGMLPQVMTTPGWAIVALFLLFTLGFAYFVFMRPEEI
jgi:hypothetical protein